MSIALHCRACDADTSVPGIPDLIRDHTDERGRFRCSRCQGTDTILDRGGDRARADGVERWTRGIVAIDPNGATSTVTPFVFLTAERPDGEVTAIEFKYYRKRRSNGRSRSGRPAGGLTLGEGQLLSLVGQLAEIGVVSTKGWRAFVTQVEGTLPVPE